jgi:hypothetical protein
MRKMLKHIRKTMDDDEEPPEPKSPKRKEPPTTYEGTSTQVTPPGKRRKRLTESSDDSDGDDAPPRRSLSGSMADTENASDRTVSNPDVPSDLDEDEKFSTTSRIPNAKKRRLGDTPASMRRQQKTNPVRPKQSISVERGDSDVTALWDFDKFMLSTSIYVLLDR